MMHSLDLSTGRMLTQAKLELSCSSQVALSLVRPLESVLLACANSAADYEKFKSLRRAIRHAQHVAACLL